MRYETFGPEMLDSVKEIYQEAGWRAYLADDEALFRAFGRSLFTLGAFDGQRLIGFVRCVGDGEHVVIVQDLIVRASHRRQGVGRRLMELTMKKYAKVRMLALFTDAGDEGANRFYQKMQLRAIGEAGCVSYMR